MFTGQFVLLAVVHATRSKGLTGPDITTSRTLSALASAEQGESGKNDVSESHDTDSSDETDDETLILVVSSRAEVTIHIITIADGIGGVGSGGGSVSVGVGSVSICVGISGCGVVIAGRRGHGRVRGSVGGVGRGPGRDEALELLGRLTCTADFTACGAFLKGEGDIIRDL